jgi:hypothetical protein
MTTDAIDVIVHEAIIQRNAYPSPLNYRKFPKSVCTYVSGIRIGHVLLLTHKSLILFRFSSINEVICHGIPDQRKLQEGDIINIGTRKHTPRRNTFSHECIPFISDVTLYYDGSCYIHRCRNPLLMQKHRFPR